MPRSCEIPFGLAETGVFREDRWRANSASRFGFCGREILGGGVGCLAFWMTGWRMSAPADAADGATGLMQALFTQTGANEAPAGTNAAAFLSYFALGFFALRWWRMADRKRSRRFSFFPVLAAGFWSAVLLLLVGKELWPGAVALMMTAATVQLASPWEQPPAPAPKRLRLRYA